MGSACCIAAKDRTHSKSSGAETLHRNVLYSPSWSVQMDTRGHVIGEIEDLSYQLSHGVNRHISMDIKGGIALGRSNHSDVESQLETFRTPASQKSLNHGEMVGNAVTLPSDLSSADNHSIEAKSSTGSAEITVSCAPKLSFSIPSTSFATSGTDPFPFPAFTVTAGSTPSRRAHLSPGHQLLRQVSDSRILGLKSPNTNSASEGRPSFVLSACSHDLTTGSLGTSSDGWSMRTFSELVAFSQRERWSFNSDAFGSGHNKICGSSSRFSCSPSTDLRTCGACSKLLSEKTSYMSSNEISVVAVLVCGHVYHADCLETMTVEANKYDPACPICTVGEKQVLKMPKTGLRGEFELKGKNYRRSRNRVTDSYFDNGYDSCEFPKVSHYRAKHPKMEPCSSTRSSFVKPFLRRHFSLGSKWGKSVHFQRMTPLGRRDSGKGIARNELLAGKRIAGGCSLNAVLFV